MLESFTELFTPENLIIAGAFSCSGIIVGFTTACICCCLYHKKKERPDEEKTYGVNLEDSYHFH